MSAAINRGIILKTRTSPTETVDSGEAYFWLEGSSLKYKDDTQTVYTLSTGVTPEEVQDLVGAFITAGSSKVSVVYNDAGNTLTIDVVEANIIHQNLSGIGTNTHAQIDSHIANTSNPHSVTKSQVGLGNVDNTSDINKPVSTAQAAADTAVQAFSIQRSNHTGTQLSTTISDFNEAAQDAVGGVLTDSASVDFTYNNVANTISAAVLPAGVDHNSLQNYVANRHIDHSAVSISAGTGLTGGGDITTNRTISMPNVGTAGTYGSASNVPVLTTDAQGRVSSVVNTAISILSTAISDFAAAVRAVILTGLTLVDSEVLATDSILTAIGKLQGQINVWTELYTSSSYVNSSNVSFVTVSELNLSVTNGNTYYIEYTICYTTAATNTGIGIAIDTSGGAAGNFGAIFNIPVNSTGTSGLYTGEFSSFGTPITSNTTSVNRSIAMIKASFVCTSSGTLNLNFRSENSGTAVTVQPGSFVLSRKF